MLDSPGLATTQNVLLIAVPEIGSTLAFVKFTAHQLSTSKCGEQIAFIKTC